MRVFANILKRLSDFLNVWLERLVVASISALIILFVVGISTRYLLGIPIIWLYETTMVIFAWSVFFGISVAFKRSEHISMNYFLDRCPEGLRKVVDLVNTSLLILFLTVVVVKGTSIVLGTASQYYHTIRLSTGWFYASFPVCAVISIIHLLSIGMNTLLSMKCRNSKVDIP